MTKTLDRATTVLDNATVLVVDDEPSLLAGLRRAFRGTCQLHTADDPLRALEMVRELPELAVVVSDMRMPGMDGVTLLSHMREAAPQAVRVLFTGYADVDAAVAAINDGAVFRFLSKPCPPEVLERCLVDAVTQHRLIKAERELLEQTLHGSVRALLETLSLANPLAFSRAERIRARVETLLQQLDLVGSWDIEMAAMLSQLGTVTLPPTATELLHAGEPISSHFRELVDGLPDVSADLLDGIPRLETVRRIIRFQNRRYDGRGAVTDGVAGEGIPLGARILRVATDFDTLGASGRRPREALEALRADPGCYDPALLSALEVATTADGSERPIDQVPLAELRSGMVLAEDLVAEGEVILCGRGQEITDRILRRVGNWARECPIQEPIAVFIGSAATTENGHAPASVGTEPLR